MSDYDLSICHGHLVKLATILGVVGNRTMADDKGYPLKDISLSYALSVAQESEAYQTGEFKGVKTVDFVPIFEKIGVDVTESLDKAIVVLNAAYVKKSAPKDYKIPAFLKFAFSNESNEITPSDILSATKLLTHIVCVVAYSSACHRDFNETAVGLDPVEHIRSLYLK
jgi:hypothetical protein